MRFTLWRWISKGVFFFSCFVVHPTIDFFGQTFPNSQWMKED
jgi:hypothetical protein